MRAIGYYPSEQEVCEGNVAYTLCCMIIVLYAQIDDMLNEVKFGRFVDKGSYVTKIDLGTFIRCM